MPHFFCHCRLAGWASFLVQTIINSHLLVVLLSVSFLTVMLFLNCGSSHHFVVPESPRASLATKHRLTLPAGVSSCPLCPHTRFACGVLHTQTASPPASPTACSSRTHRFPWWFPLKPNRHNQTDMHSPLLHQPKSRGGGAVSSLSVRRVDPAPAVAGVGFSSSAGRMNRGPDTSPWKRERVRQAR